MRRAAWVPGYICFVLVCLLMVGIEHRVSPMLGKLH